MRDKIGEESQTIATILRHTGLVSSYLRQLARALEERADTHDLSKFSNDEFAGFVEINRIAREHKYGSPEYKRAISENNAVSLHYSHNPHHPEHHENGVSDMSLIDLIEMVVDWKAASITYGQTSLQESLEIQTGRFNLSASDLRLIKLVLLELE